MKKTLCLIFTLIMICSLILTGCGSSTNEPTESETTTITKKDVFSGTAADVLAKITTNSKADMGMVGDQEINLENCQDLVGLTPEQYEQYITDASASVAMINVNAHLVVLLKAKDFDSATEVKTLIASNFNPQRWVCVLPEKCLVVESGSYVMLVASFAETADALSKSFTSLAKETAGDVDVFYTSED